MKKRLLSLFTVLVMLFIILTVHVCAASYDSDWRVAARTPRISFRDAQGELIQELSNLWINDEALSFDSSTVSYGDIQQLDYQSIDLSVSCVDYNYMIYGENQNLPDNEAVLAELTFGNKKLEADQILCTATAKGYLQVDLLFEDVFFFDGENSEAEVYIQFRRKSMAGDETTDISKGSVLLTFANLLLPNTAEEEVEDEPLQVELILPEEEITEEVDIEAQKPYILIEECSIEDGWSAVTAGNGFDVTILCKNIHRSLDLDNVLVQVDAPDGLRLMNPSNTFYIGSVANEESFPQIFHFQTMLDTASKDYCVTVRFSYEYIDGDDRKEENISQEIVIPVRQSSHFTVDELSVRPEYIVGEASSLYSSYANMGRGPLYNVTASLQTDLISDVKVLHLGNLAAGEGGSLEFEVQSEEVGTYPVEILYSYETESGQRMEEAVKAEMCFELSENTINEEPVIQYITEFPSADQGNSGISWEAVLLMMLGGLGLVVIAMTRKNKQKNTGR